MGWIKTTYTPVPPKHHRCKLPDTYMRNDRRIEPESIWRCWRCKRVYKLAFFWLDSCKLRTWEECVPKPKKQPDYYDY